MFDQEGTTHGLFIIGTGPLKTLEGVSLKQAELYKTMVRFTLFPPHPGPADAVDITKLPGVRSMEILSERVQVPARETTYWCVIKKLGNLDVKHHIIQVMIFCELTETR